MKETIGIILEIHGTGNRQFNRDLSRLRAEVVRYYLAEKGISDTRLLARGYGADSPIANNLTATGRQRNRRTEIIFHTLSVKGN